MAVSDLSTSQFGVGQLGLMQLGMVREEGSVPPPTVPDMSTWYVAMSFPEPIIFEVEAY